MLEIPANNYSCANYRVRLFLSVDLSGSTAFKNSDVGTGRDAGASPKWVNVFQSFYKDFPNLFQSHYHDTHVRIAGPASCPSLWKAVGDELVFCGVVHNKRSVLIALNAFVSAMTAYRKTLADGNLALNLKGAAWLAAFPEPNRAVQLRRLDGDPDYLSASEALEEMADRRPFDFDFLGKAIDTGFRIASLAAPERFILSVQLARLLLSMRPGDGNASDINFDTPVVLKGVNKGVPYPVLYLETVEHLSLKEVLVKQRRMLGGGRPEKDVLADYLTHYCCAAGTEEIMLPHDINDGIPLAPPSYTDHREKIAEHLGQEQGREPDDHDPVGDSESGGFVGLEGEIDDLDDLDPLPESFSVDPPQTTL